MPDTKDLFCWRVMLMVAAFGTYVASFAISSVEWVLTDADVTWGLWTARTTINGTVEDSYLDPTDQPGYYNAVRTLSCFALVLYISFFFMCDPAKGLGSNTIPVKVCVAINILVTVMLLVLGLCYKDDDRWKDLSPELGWCYYVCLASDIIVFLIGLISYKLYKATNPTYTKSSKTKVAPQKQTPKAKPDQKKENQGKKEKPPPKKKEDPKTTTEEKEKEGSETTEKEKKKEGDSTKPSLTTVAVVRLDVPADPPATGEGGASSSPAVDIEAQNHNLDPYDVPGSPVDGHLAPMPDYQLAAGESMEDVMAARPRVVIPEKSIWKMPKKALKYTASFLKDYAKSAVTGGGVGAGKSGGGGKSESEGGKAKGDGGESSGGKRDGGESGSGKMVEL